MNPHCVLMRDPAAVTRRLGHQTVILPVRRGVPDPLAVYSLNETGSFIWDRCDGTTQLGTIVQDLAAAFAVDAEQARGDASALIGKLCEEGLLIERSRSPGQSR